MRRSLLITIALLALAAPALAQPPRFANAAQALYAQAHLTAASSDDEKRVVTIQLAEQMAFEFPGQGWGAKTAGAGRPISKDCVAKAEQLTGSTIVKGVCYDWILGGGGVKLPPIVNDIPGQVFVPVAAVDHLGAKPPSAPPSDSGGNLSALEARIAALESRLEDARTAFAALEGRVSALEKTLPSMSHDVTDLALSDIEELIRQQLETSKAILELLQKTATRFRLR